jgi:hypothetical protein
MKRGKINTNILWKQDGVRREVKIDGEFTGSEIVRIVAEIVNTNEPDSGWLEGYACGRREGVNATRLEYAEKLKKDKVKK